MELWRICINRWFLFGGSARGASFFVSLQFPTCGVVLAMVVRGLPSCFVFVFVVGFGDGGGRFCWVARCWGVITEGISGRLIRFKGSMVGVEKLCGAHAPATVSMSWQVQCLIHVSTI